MSTEVLIRKAEAVLLAAHSSIAAAEDYAKVMDTLSSHLRRGIPVRYAQVALVDDLQDTAPLRHARAFLRLKHRPTFLMLAGALGTGKTWAAAWVAVQTHARFVSAVQLVGLPRFRSDALEELEQASALVLDDVGEETSELWARDRVVSMLCARYTHARLTVLTTNLNQADFVERYGPRLADRLRESCAYHSCPGASLRKPSAASSDKWSQLQNTIALAKKLTAASEGHVREDSDDDDNEDTGKISVPELKELLTEACAHFNLPASITPVPPEKSFSARRAKTLTLLQETCHRFSSPDRLSSGGV